MNQIKLFLLFIFLNSCTFGSLNLQYNTSYNLPSMGSGNGPSNSEYFYFDIDEAAYRSSRQLPPYYEISTTEEYGDGNRDSLSNCEIPLTLTEEEGDLALSEASENLICILDLLEGDIQVKDLHLTFNFPEGMCSYVRTGLPWHFNHQISAGPSIETCPITKEDTTIEGYKIGAQGECKEYPEGFEEEDLCPGDPKCCNGGKKSDGSEWEPEIECFGGPALVAEGETALPKKDFFRYLVRELPEGGLKESFTLPNIISINGGQSSVTHANYVKKLDRAPDDLSSVKRTQLPNALQASDNYNYDPRLFFELECLDSGSEVLHKILVMIREWNTLEEFWDFYLEGGNDTADPDVEGDEGDKCDYEDRTMLEDDPAPCNDEKDMDDYDTEYPGIDYSGDFTVE